jgi:hypothetical protein
MPLGDDAAFHDSTGRFARSSVTDNPVGVGGLSAGTATVSV